MTPIILNHPSKFKQYKEYIIQKLESPNQMNDAELKISEIGMRCLRRIKEFFNDEENTKGIIILPKHIDKDLVPSLAPYILGCNKLLFISPSLKSVKKFKSNITGKGNNITSIYVDKNIIGKSNMHNFQPSTYTMVKKRYDTIPPGYLAYIAHITNITKEDDSFILNNNNLNLSGFLDAIKETNIDLIIIDDIYQYSNDIWNFFISSLYDDIHCIFLSDIFYKNKKRKTIGGDTNKNKLPLKIIGIFQD